MPKKLDEKAEIKRQKDLMRQIAEPGRRSDDAPMMIREAPIRNIDADNRTFDVMWSGGAGVRRYDWYRSRWFIEELSMDPAHIRMERLKSGRSPVIDSHWSWSLRDVLGVVRSADVADGEGTAEILLSQREEVAGILTDVRDGIIANVSVGYNVYRFVMYEPENEGGMWRYVATDWEPMEISLVPIGADPDAGIRGEEDPRFKRCTFISAAPEPHNTPKESRMDIFTIARGAGVQFAEDADAAAVRGLLAKRFNVKEDASDEEIVAAAFRKPDQAPPPESGEKASEARAAERKRCGELEEFCRKHRAPDGFYKKAIDEEWTIERSAHELLKVREAQGDGGPALIPPDLQLRDAAPVINASDIFAARRKAAGH